MGRVIAVVILVLYMLFSVTAINLYPHLCYEVNFAGEVEYASNLLWWSHLMISFMWAATTWKIKDECYRSAIGAMSFELAVFTFLMFCINCLNYKPEEYYLTLVITAGLSVATFYQIRLGLTSRMKLLSYLWMKLF